MNEINNPSRRRRKRRRKRKSKRKLVLAVILAVIVIIVLAVAAIAFVFNGNSNTPVNSNSDEAVQTSENTSAESTTGEDNGSDKIQKEAEEILNSMTLEEKVNQMFFITPEALTNVGCAVAAGEQTKAALENHPVGGIIYFSQNFTGENQTKEMISNIKEYGKEVCKVPLFIGIDEEGGTVARLGNNENINVPKVSNMSEIGKSGDTQKAYDAGKTIGKYLAEYGFNVDFAPVADVLSNPENQVVKERSFGSDTNIVSGMALQVSNALNDEGLFSCYKHFPGHGATKDDTHEGFAYTDKTYEELASNELVPFVTAISNDADFIMVGHISLPNVVGDNTPASISSVIINDILKEKLGYEGIIITDSLSMGALTNLYQSDEIAVRTINAGADMLLMPLDFEQAYNGVLNAVNSGKISEERINESVLKIIEKKLSHDM